MASERPRDRQPDRLETGGFRVFGKVEDRFAGRTKAADTNVQTNAADLCHLTDPFPAARGEA
jgi:hypothetical protein